MENKIRLRKIYSEDYKRKVVSEVSLGFSLEFISRKYGIKGNTTVSRWCKDYGLKTTEIEYVDLPLVEKLEPLKVESMAKLDRSSTEKNLKKTESDRIKLLEYELALYKKLVEIAKRDYDLDLVKKLNTKPSEK